MVKRPAPDLEDLLLSMAAEAAGLPGPRTERCGDMDPAWLWRRAGEEGLRGLIAERLARSDTSLANVVRRGQLNDFAHGARLRRFLHDLGERLHDHGLQVLVLKGAALVDLLYDGHWSRRPMSDLDLLPRPRDLERVQRLLEQWGLRRTTTCWRAEGVDIDLHDDLIGSEYLERRSSAFRFDVEDLWSQRVPMGPGLARLGETHQALHLAVHGLKHAYGRWIWLLDLALLLPRLDGETVLTTAQRTGTERVLAYACAAVHHVFGGTIPPWADALPALSPLEHGYLQAVLTRPQPFQLGGTITGLSIDDPFERLAYWAELVWPKHRLLRAAEGQDRPGRRWRRIFHKGLPSVAQLLRLSATSRSKAPTAPVVSKR